MPDGVTYAEVRRWARWLSVFTAADLAAALRSSMEVGERGVKALLWHGICVETGDLLPGPDGAALPLLEYVPLPAGPRFHPRELPPEAATPGVYSEAPRRGMPIPSRRRSDGSIRNRRPGRTGAQS